MYSLEGWSVVWQEGLTVKNIQCNLSASFLASLQAETTGFRSVSTVFSQRESLPNRAMASAASVRWWSLSGGSNEQCGRKAAIFYQSQYGSACIVKTEVGLQLSTLMYEENYFYCASASSQRDIVLPFMSFSQSVCLSVCPSRCGVVY